MGCKLLKLLGLAISAWALMTVSGVGDDANIQRRGEAELLALHQADRRAHFTHDLNALLAHTAANVIDVRNGKVTVLSRADLSKRFAEYLRRAEFSAWDDVQTPIVQVSGDGRTGWMVVRVHIAYTETNSAGEQMPHDETMAWMSAYEKQSGKWMMTAVTSTSDKD